MTNGSPPMSERDDLGAADAPASGGDQAVDPATADTGKADASARVEPVFAWTPELASGRSPTEPNADAPAPRRRLLDRLIWIAGLAVAIGIASGIASSSGGPAPTGGFEQGRLAGGIFFRALFVAFILWAVVVWLTRRGNGRRLTSPMVPLIAIVLLLASLSATVSKGGATTATASPTASMATAPSPRTLDAVLVIAAPYHLERSPAAEEQQFAAVFNAGDTTFLKNIQVRRIYLGADLSGYALVGDVGVRAGNEAVAMAGVELGLGSDVTKRHVTIGSHDAISGVAGGAGYVVWIEAPWVKVVFAQTEQDANVISGAFVTS
jgi:hypothetical protein